MKEYLKNINKCIRIPMKGDKGVGQYKGNGGKRGISCVQPGLLVGRAAWAWVVPAGELVVRSVCLFVFIQVTVTSIQVGSYLVSKI